MKSILYLWAMAWKNRFFQLLKKPALLILYIVIVGLIVFTVLVSQGESMVGRAFLDITILKSIFFLLLIIFAILGIQRGLSNGGSFFGMEDVNFMFVSAINPKLILVYGITRQVKTAFLTGFFILFQSSNLRLSFGVDFSGVLLLLGTFILSAILFEIVAMFIYSLTNGNPKSQNIVKLVVILLFVPAVIQFVYFLMAQGDSVNAFYMTMNAWCINAIPVVGWMTQGLVQLLTGHVFAGLMFIGLTVLFGIAMLMFIALYKSDYYEDVLCATETNFEKVRAKMEGNLNMMGNSGRKIKVSGTGISGWGAGVFWRKHLRESFRENRLKLFSIQSIFIFLGCVVFAVLAQGSLNLIVLLQILMWMQIFMIGTGRGLKELFSHYIYMIPADPVAKLVFSNVESVIRALVESIFIFGVTGIILKDHALVILTCIFVYTLFTMVLLGINYLSMRIFESTINRGLLMAAYIIGVLIMMAPGIALAIFVAIKAQTAIGLLLLAVWEIALSLVCFGLSKRILHDCDMITLYMPK